jgi:hypothetical protein
MFIQNSSKVYTNCSDKCYVSSERQHERAKMKYLATVLITTLLVACGTPENEAEQVSETYTEIQHLIFAKNNEPEQTREANAKEFIDPCGDQAQGIDDLIVRTIEGELLPVYQGDTSNWPPAPIAPGEYVTTDGSECHFIITEVQQVIWVK